MICFLQNVKQLHTVFLYHVELVFFYILLNYCAWKIITILFTGQTINKKQVSACLPC